MKLFKFAYSLKYHPVNQHDEPPIKDFMLNASKLLLMNNVLSTTNDSSEDDLLHKLWSFIYKLFEQGSIERNHEERCSDASALGKNGGRILKR